MDVANSRNSQTLEQAVNSGQIKLVIWDWYKSLSNDHLYKNLEKNNPGAYEIIQDYFVSDNKRLQKWVRGDLSFEKIHAEFAKITGLEAKVFDDSLSELSEDFAIEADVLVLVREFSKRKITQIIATDNYDIWDEFFLPQYSQYFGEYFVDVYNSANFRMLVQGDHLEFMNTILNDFSLAPSQVLLVDDNETFGGQFADIGGFATIHKNFPDLREKLGFLFA